MSCRPTPFPVARSPFRVPATSNRCARRSGMSLIEVILAIAILGMSMALIGELVRIGARSARDARDSATAQLLCETRISEIAAGLFSSDPVPLTTFEDFPDWQYTVDSEPAQQQGLLSIRVTVQADMPEQKYPVSFSLSRWIVDPKTELDAASQDAANAQSASQTSTGSSSSTSGGAK